MTPVMTVNLTEEFCFGGVKIAKSSPQKNINVGVEFVIVAGGQFHLHGEGLTLVFGMAGFTTLGKSGTPWGVPGASITGGR